MASSRKVSIADHLNQEEAWNYGASISGYIPLFGKTLNLNLEYYYTDFLKQVVVDMDTNPHEVAFLQSRRTLVLTGISGGGHLSLLSGILADCRISLDRRQDYL